MEMRFVVSTKPEHHPPSEAEHSRILLLALLHSSIGGMPYGRTLEVPCRTPFRIFPVADDFNRGSRIAFRVFNVTRERCDKIAEELRLLSDVQHVLCEGGGRHSQAHSGS